MPQGHSQEHPTSVLGTTDEGSHSLSGSGCFSPSGPSPGEPENKGLFFPKRVSMGGLDKGREGATPRLGRLEGTQSWAWCSPSLKALRLGGALFRGKSWGGLGTAG